MKPMCNNSITDFSWTAHDHELAAAYPHEMTGRKFLDYFSRLWRWQSRLFQVIRVGAFQGNSSMISCARPHAHTRKEVSIRTRCSSTTSATAYTVAATRSSASRARSGPVILTADFFSHSTRPRRWEMAGGTDGRRAALGMGHLTPGLISSSPGKAGLPPFIAFTTGLSTTAWPYTAHTAVDRATNSMGGHSRRY
jgi:hypothetical protein